MAADLIFYNGRIFTGTGENGYRICSAAAIKDGRFLAAGNDAEILALADENTEKVDCGVYLISDASDDAELEYAAARRAEDTVGDLFAIHTAKYFMEGSFALLEPYNKEFNEASGNPEDYRGETTWDTETVKKSFRRAAELGFQIHCHAMGDASVHQTIEALESVIPDENNVLRHTIAHLMLVPPEDKIRLGRKHIVASIQPRWMVYDNDIHSYFPLFGQERAETCYPDRSLSDCGAVTAYGAIYP